MKSRITGERNEDYLDKLLESAKTDPGLQAKKTEPSRRGIAEEWVPFEGLFMLDYENPVTSVSWLPDEKLAVVIEGMAIEIHKIYRSVLAKHGSELGNFRVCRASPDGTYIAVSGFDGSTPILRIHDDNNVFLDEKCVPHEIYDIAWDSDCEYFLTLDREGTQLYACEDDDLRPSAGSIRLGARRLTFSGGELRTWNPDLGLSHHNEENYFNWRNVNEQFPPQEVTELVGNPVIPVSDMVFGTLNGELVYGTIIPAKRCRPYVKKPRGMLATRRCPIEVGQLNDVAIDKTRRLLAIANGRQLEIYEKDEPTN